MKFKTKLFISALLPILFMAVLPWLSIHSAEGLAGTGLWFLAFFSVNPLMVIFLSILAGTELRRLWWIPLALAAIFPLLFGLAIGEWVWDLYVYSALYLPLGLGAMLITHGVRKRSLPPKR